MPNLNKWAEFLRNGENKNDLISLYLIFIKSPEGIKLAEGIVFYEKQIVWNIRPYSTELLFRCNHEEADTKRPPTSYLFRVGKKTPFKKVV